MDRAYCTVAELVADLFKTVGCDETAMLEHIRSASQFIDQRLGMFIPVTETRYFCGHGRTRLNLPPMLGVISIVNDDVTLSTSDYLLYAGDQPGRMWENGPYTALVVDPDATNLGSWSDTEDGVAITARWGLYERSVSTGATVQNNPLAAVDTALVVADGSKLSPGMVLLLETEQALVTATGALTAAVTTVTESVALTDDELTLANETLVKAGEVIRIDFEKCLILDTNSTTHKAAVIRGYNGTKQAVHADNAAVDVYRTYTISRAANGTTAAAHAQGTAISRYVPPEDIKILAKQVSALIKKLADSGYAGRTGNAELGQVFYNDIVSKFNLELIEQNYEVGV